MKTKKYFDVFGDTAKHPKSEEFSKNVRARIALAEAIHNERVSQSLSMQSLAEKANTTPAVISRIENAQVSTGIDMIYRVFRTLGKDQIHLNFAG